MIARVRRPVVVNAMVLPLQNQRTIRVRSAATMNLRRRQGVGVFVQPYTNLALHDTVLNPPLLVDVRLPRR